MPVSGWKEEAVRGQSGGGGALEALHVHLGCPMGQQSSVWKAGLGQVRRCQPSPGWRTVEARGNHGSEVGGAQREGRPEPTPAHSPLFFTAQASFNDPSPLISNSHL